MSSLALRLLPVVFVVGCATRVTTIVVDHPTGNFYRVEGEVFGPGFKLGPDKRIKADEVVVPPGDLHVRVVNTNTALYSYGVSADALVAPEVAALNGFFKDFRSASIEVFRDSYSAKMHRPGGAESGTRLESIERLEKAVRSVEKDVVGSSGFQEIYFKAFGALEQMVGMMGSGEVAVIAEKFCGDVAGQFVPRLLDCSRTASAVSSRLDVIGKLIDSLDELRQARHGVEAVVSKSDSEIVSRADDLLGSSEQLLAAAQNVRLMALRVAFARDYFVEETKVTLEKGRKVTVSVAPVGFAPLQRMADRPPLTRTLEVRPDWMFRPALGVSLLYVPSGRYPKFGTEAVVDGITKNYVITEGRTDQRFNYGLTLSVAPRWLDFRNRKVSGGRDIPAAVWGEVTYNPFTAQQSIALGPAVSVGFLKLGAGAYWARADSLVGGQQVGGVLVERADLRTDPSYKWSDSRFYISLSVVGWQPFSAK